MPSRLLLHQTRDVDDPHACIHLSFRSAEYLMPPRGFHDLNETSEMTFESNQVLFRSDWCEGCLDLNEPLGMDLFVHPGGQHQFAAILENALRIMVAYRILDLGGILLHSNAIVQGGKSVVLFGHSGAGKSTTAAIAAKLGCAIISDDLNAIVPETAGWSVNSVPFSGSFSSTPLPRIDKAPLHALYRLRQADFDSSSPSSAAEAVMLLFGNAAFVNGDPYRALRLLSILSELASDVPVSDLYFKPEAGFMDIVFGHTGSS